jgi:hypothetical protein
MILETIGSLVVGAIGAGVAWGVTEFLARPIRKFFDLRFDAVRTISQYGNLRARYNERRLANDVIETSEDHTLSEAESARLHEAEVALRALAAQMKGFAFNETIASRALLLFGYDPKKASEGLFGIANTVDKTGDTRIMSKKWVTDALRLPEHTL